MIRARHSQIHRLIFRHYLQRLLRRHFSAVNLLNSVPDIPKELPIILVPNHSTWWDGFLSWHLNEALFQRKFYLMMLEEELSKYRFFSRLGAFSINRNSATAMLPTLKYVIETLEQNTVAAPLMTLFPQGELLPLNIRPLGFQRGLDWIVRRISRPIAVLPLALRAEFLNQQRPGVFIRFGQPLIIPANESLNMRQLEDSATRNLDLAGREIVAGTVYSVLLQGKKSLNQSLDQVRGKRNSESAADSVADGGR